MSPKCRSTGISEELRQKLLRDFGVGPTGDYPHGKLNVDDEGGLNVALSHFDAPDGARMVRLDFGKPVVWLALPRAAAIAFGRMMIHHAGEANDEGLPGPAGDE